MRKLIVVLPVYNEEINLGPLVTDLETTCEELARLGYARHYIVVDDGSRDGTPALLRRLQEDLPMEVITHEFNQGLGKTIQDGLRRASTVAKGDDIIFTMDADNTHRADLMQSLIQEIHAGNDVVIASRYRRGARVVGLRWYRRLLSLGARALFQLLFPIPGVRDYTSGYRAYRATSIKTALETYGDQLTDQEGFQCMADILIRLSRLGVRFSEVPMILRYDYKSGSSKMRVGATVARTLKLMAVRRLQG